MIIAQISLVLFSFVALIQFLIAKNAPTPVPIKPIKLVIKTTI